MLQNVTATTTTEIMKHVGTAMPKAKLALVQALLSPA